MSRTPALFVATLVSLLAACRETSPPLARPRDPARNQSEGLGIVNRFAFLGTSVSGGTCSDGVVWDCQQHAWAAQLIGRLHGDPDMPFVADDGCKSPLVAPLVSYRRRSGESVGTPEDRLSCAPNLAGVKLPTWNLAIDGILTHEVLATTTMETGLRRQLWRRMMPPNVTVMAALESLDPNFVAVELGANDILGVLSGAIIAGVTYAPFPAWAAAYAAILDRVGAITKRALIVGGIRDLARLPGVRYGRELWADRAAFRAAFNVEIGADCDGSRNLIVVNVLVPGAVAQGLGRRAQGAGPYLLGCAAAATRIPDRIITPSELAFINTQLIQMSDFMKAQAEARGYAFFELSLLYDLPKGTYSVVDQMTAEMPYGPNISLDGLHPSAAGHTILAEVAAHAIDARYQFGLFDTVAKGLGAHEQ